MRMTKQQREAVVELLRVAADVGCVALPFSSAVDRLTPSLCVERRAYSAWRAVYNECLLKRRHGVETSHGWYVSQSETLLEAAARCEEGSWP
jgi:hypothetical protein